MEVDSKVFAICVPFSVLRKHQKGHCSRQLISEIRSAILDGNAWNDFVMEVCSGGSAFVSK